MFTMLYYFIIIIILFPSYSRRLRGATVARLTPDQKVACSNHVGVMSFIPHIN